MRFTGFIALNGSMFNHRYIYPCFCLKLLFFNSLVATVNLNFGVKIGVNKVIKNDN